MTIGRSDRSLVSSYTLVKEVSATSSAPTAFPFGTVSGDINLLHPNFGGVGKETESYRLEILITGQPAGSAVVVITGSADSGPEEMICSLACTVGAVIETGDWRWVDTITPTNYHICDLSMTVADSGNSHPCKVGFDAAGYKYINFYVPTLTTTTNLRIYARSL